MCEKTGIKYAIDNLESFSKINHKLLNHTRYSLAAACIVLFPALILIIFLKGSDINLVYAVLCVFVLVFGVLIGLYRFHFNEIIKAENNKIGFIRIGIAADNTNVGFQSEVRRSLTENAFNSSAINHKKNKQVESPLPGYLGSDLGVMMLNKIFDEFELKKISSEEEEKVLENKE